MTGWHKPTPCCLCQDQAVAIYYLPWGCAARPDLTVQPLCSHHERKSQPIGRAMELLKDLRIRPVPKAPPIPSQADHPSTSS